MIDTHDRWNTRRSSSRFDRSRPGRPRRRRIDCPLAIESLECRCCLSLAPGLASAAINLPVDPNVGLAGQLTGVGATELYHIRVDADGILVAQVHAPGLDTRLSLLDGQGHLLIESEASSPRNPDDNVAMHVVTGDYLLMVQDTSGSGPYQFSTRFTAATAPAQPLSGGQGSYSVAVADLNGDKIPDIITADYYLNQVLVNLGTGDGTFQPPVAIPVGTGPVFVTTADLTGDGIQDIITANQSSNDVSILLGNGDGTFQPAIEVPAGDGPIERGGRRLHRRREGRPGRHRLERQRCPDLAGSGRRDVHAGRDHRHERLPGVGGRGRLRRRRPHRPRGGDDQLQPDRLPGQRRRHLHAGPAARDRPRLRFGDRRRLQRRWPPRPGRGLLRRRHGEDLRRTRTGAFVASAELQTGSIPTSLAAADFNGDGRLDLAASNYGTGDVSIFFGQGDGTFQPQIRVPAGVGPESVVAADLNGDGRTDLVVADYIGLSVSVLLGNGNGTFQTPNEPTTSTSPPSVVAADLTGNGIQDLIVPNENTNDRIDPAGPGRRHLPLADQHPGRSGSLGRGGRRLQRRRNPRPGRHERLRRHRLDPASATATARSGSGRN